MEGKIVDLENQIDMQKPGFEQEIQFQEKDKTALKKIQEMLWSARFRNIRKKWIMRWVSFATRRW